MMGFGKKSHKKKDGHRGWGNNECKGASGATQRRKCPRRPNGGMVVLEGQPPVN